VRHRAHLNKTLKPYRNSLSLWWIFLVHHSELSLHISARSWLIKPKTTLCVFHTTLRLHNYWLVDHIWLHFL
jgi:hypothetical protein